MFHGYPYTDFHETNLDWFLNTFKSILSQWDEMKILYDNLDDAVKALQDYVEDYFDNLDVQQEINNKLDQMVADGTLIQILSDYLPFVTPQMFGAVGDGVTDDTEAMQSALNASELLFIPVGTYLINDTGVTVSNQKTVVLDANAIIKKAPTSASNYAIMRINSDNVKIYGGQFIGDLDEHTGSTEFGHNIIIGDANNIVIDGVKTSKSMGDCIYVGGSAITTLLPENITIRNCEFGECGRDAISIISAINMLVEGNNFVGCNICIDIEPNKATEKNKDITIRNNKSTGCTKLVAFNYSYAVTDINIIVDGWLSVDDNADVNTGADSALFYTRVPGGALGVDGRTTIKNITVVNSTGTIIKIRRVAYGATDLSQIYNDCKFIGCSAAKAVSVQLDSNNDLDQNFDLFVKDSAFDSLIETLHAAASTTSKIKIIITLSGDQYSDSDVTLGDGTRDTVDIFSLVNSFKKKLVTLTSPVGTATANLTRYNSLVIYQVNINTTAAVSLNQIIINDLLPCSANGIGATLINVTDQSAVDVRIDAATLRAVTPLASGKSYRGILVYFTSL